jgi:membrane associated rhomboid family serine protease
MDRHISTTFIRVGRWTPWLTLLSVAVMVGVYHQQSATADPHSLFLYADAAGSTRWIQSTTAIFSHFDPGHVGANAVGLIVLGPFVELAYGRRWVLAGFAVAVMENFVFHDSGRAGGASVWVMVLGAFAVVAAIRHIPGLLWGADDAQTFIAGMGLWICGITVGFQALYDLHHLGQPVAYGAAVVGHSAHLAGLAGGLVLGFLSAIVHLPHAARSVRAELVSRRQWRNHRRRWT